MRRRICPPCRRDMKAKRLVQDAHTWGKEARVYDRVLPAAFLFGILVPILPDCSSDTYATAIYGFFTVSYYRDRPELYKQSVDRITIITLLNSNCVHIPRATPHSTFGAS